MRVKRGTTSRKKHKKLLTLTKGYKGGRSKLVKRAKEASIKAGVYSFAGRKLKKRDFRKLWITRLSATLEEYNLSYSQFIKKLKEKQIEIDRKILAQLAIEEPKVFEKIIDEIKSK